MKLSRHVDPGASGNGGLEGPWKEVGYDSDDGTFGHGLEVSVGDGDNHVQRLALVTR